jgi:ATP-dependent Lon protease
LEDKLIISRDYILPELYKKFGLVNIIEFDEKLLEFIISNYTNEPGVRKLKEVLFEIISSINLDLLKNINSYNIPVIISKELIETILCDRHQTSIVKINDKSKVGIVNGMWANSLGNGGILHIESKFFHTNTFMELKLTGMQGDVMKESMTVSKTLALSLLDKKVLNNIMKNFEETKMQGFHLHVPEGATPKDGPSAGAAITLVLYSLLTNKKIKNTFAITGEINLQGNITAIGGLDLKFLGGIKAGVKTFLYPKDNEKDFLLYCKKHSSLVEKYKYISVSHISEVLKLMLE